MGEIAFQLTPEIIDIIIFGMENQSDEYCVDIRTGAVISETVAEEEYEDEDIESYLIPVPDWFPADGFQLMESFVASLHNPIYRESLRDVLSAGRGAFRNFKNTIKEHESLTQQWYLHKEKVMRARVIEWYNLNSEILKYRDIDENTDETEDLILSDFIFITDSSKWNKIISEKSAESIRESLEEENGPLTDYLIDRMEMLSHLPGNIPVSICAETVEGEFAAFIGGVLIKTAVSRRLVAVVNTIWVEKKFRGLGIARHLIDEFSKNVLENKAEMLVFELPGNGIVLGSTLKARGASTFFTTMAVNS